MCNVSAKTCTICLENVAINAGETFNKLIGLFVKLDLELHINLCLKKNLVYLSNILTLKIEAYMLGPGSIE